VAKQLRQHELAAQLAKAQLALKLSDKVRNCRPFVGAAHCCPTIGNAVKPTGKQRSQTILTVAP
jgi:hypothetical protein